MTPKHAPGSVPEGVPGGSAPAGPETAVAGSDRPAPTAAEPAVAAAEPAAEPEGTASADPAPKRPGWATSTHLLVAVLCALLGFAIVTQVRQTHSDEFSLLRQNDLVALLDEITQRNDQLELEQAQLVLDRNDLVAGIDAGEVADRNATTQAILAGTVPVWGPGVDITVTETAGPIPASSWVNLVEELRNAGAEAVEVGGTRFGAASWFADTSRGVVIDGMPLSSPVKVRAIGDPQTLEVALEIRGGALSTLRSQGAVTEVTRSEKVTIDSVVALRAPQIAVPAPEDNGGTG